MKAIYVPAVHPSAVIIPGANPYDIPLHWLDKRYPDRYYPHVLWSYAYWGTEKAPKHLGDGVQVLGDSGGYAVITQGESFDPARIIRWQLRHCTRGMILDIPPYRPSSNVQFTGVASEYFEESLRRTQENVRMGMREYQTYVHAAEVNQMDPEFAWWGVVQGESLEQMQRWYDGIRSVFPFDGLMEGWALAPKPSTDLLACARYMRFARDNHLRSVHVLQVTKPRTVATIVSLAHMSGSFDLLTYDSATQTRAAINRTMLLNNGLGFSHLRQTGDGGVVMDEMEKCECPGCGTYRQIREEYGKPADTQLWRYITLHNQFVLRQVFDNIHREAEKDPEDLLRRSAEKEYGPVLREWEGSLAQKGTKHAVSIFDRIR